MYCTMLSFFRQNFLSNCSIIVEEHILSLLVIHDQMEEGAQAGSTSPEMGEAAGETPPECRLVTA